MNKTPKEACVEILKDKLRTIKIAEALSHGLGLGRGDGYEDSIAEVKAALKWAKRQK